MSTQRKSRGSYLARILKKDISELKMYFKELGLVVEKVEKIDKDTKEKREDIWVYFGRIKNDEDEAGF